MLAPGHRKRSRGREIDAKYGTWRARSGEVWVRTGRSFWGTNVEHLPEVAQAVHKRLLGQRSPDCPLCQKLEQLRSGSVWELSGESFVLNTHLPIQSDVYAPPWTAARGKERRLRGCASAQPACAGSGQGACTQAWRGLTSTGQRVQTLWNGAARNGTRARWRTGNGAVLPYPDAKVPHITHDTSAESAWGRYLGAGESALPTWRRSSGARGLTACTPPLARWHPVCACHVRLLYLQWDSNAQVECALDWFLWFVVARGGQLPTRSLRPPRPTPASLRTSMGWSRGGECAGASLLQRGVCHRGGKRR